MKNTNPISLIKVLDSTKTKVIDNTNKISSDEPFVTFSLEDEVRNIYCVKILACIPSWIDDFVVNNPSEKEKNSTYLGEILARTITISWDENTSPFEHPQSLWYLFVRYQLFGDVDKGIRVNYQFGDPETTRGTVTTSGSGAL